ncbi:MAG TPA: hypothetical protein VIZ28_06690 [Chitinophagaceae bacterium]
MKRFLIPSLFISFMLASCFTSFQPLVTYENITTDNRLAGSWEQSGKNVLIRELGKSHLGNLFADARKENKPFSERDSIFLSKHYVITYREKGVAYTWVAALVKIGQSTFVNLAPEECNIGNKIITPKGEDTYSFAKLEWNTGNSCQLRFLDGDYIKELVLNNKIRIRHEYDPLFGTFVITASAQELEQFLEKYGNDERVYKRGNSINLSRKI